MAKTVAFNPNNKKHLKGIVTTIKKLQALNSTFKDQERAIMISSEVYRDIIDFSMKTPWLKQQ